MVEYCYGNYHLEWLQMLMGAHLSSSFLALYSNRNAYNEKKEVQGSSRQPESPENILPCYKTVKFKSRNIIVNDRNAHQQGVILRFGISNILFTATNSIHNSIPQIICNRFRNSILLITSRVFI